MQRRTVLITALGAATWGVARSQPRREDYPSRPVTLVVGFAAGGPTDRIARVVAEPLSRHFGHNFVVENRAGANGAVATIQIKGVPPDGHKLLFSGSGGLVMAPLLNSKIGYRTLTDLTPIARVSNYPYFLVVPASSPFKTTAELVSKGREKSQALSYASAGPGSGNHMASEWFQAATRTQMVHVPYGGDAAALPDVMTGRVDFAFLSGSVVLQQAQAGKLRILATATTQPERAQGFPTVEEAAGIRGFAMEPWTGIFGPAGMDPDTVERINNAVAELLSRPEIQKQLSDIGQYAFPAAPAPFREFIESQATQWTAIVRDANIPRE
jgi:tripartite-type tricarboxylate transporter receptor subunit TctC